MTIKNLYFYNATIQVVRFKPACPDCIRTGGVYNFPMKSGLMAQQITIEPRTRNFEPVFLCYNYLNLYKCQESNR